MIAARLTSALHELSQRPLVRNTADQVTRALDKRRAAPEPALDADRHEIVTADAGTLSYYADLKASGRPLVLIHGVHAAASSYEMGPLFEAFRGRRKVYALDLPGFGFSERSARAYTPATYVHAIEHLLRHVGIREPVDVIALSLSSEYAAKVAVEMPELVRSLVLISPTGFAAPKRASLLEMLSRRLQGQVQDFSELLGSRLLYEALVSKPSLRLFLRRSFEAKVHPGLLSYAHATSHQPGAWRAPIAFLAGALFPAGDAKKKTYGHVRAPTLVLYDQDPYTSFDELAPFVGEHPGFRAKRVSHTRGLPQFDAPQQTIEALRGFYGELDATHQHGLPGGNTFGNGRFIGSA
jgi:pimeloyl-ACP methyl ester carboxylesterase